MTTLRADALAGLGLDADDEDELDGLTELEKFSPERVDGVSTPASGFPILFMKSLGDAFAGTPTPDPQAVERETARRAAQEQAQVRKAVQGAVTKALSELVAEHVAELRRRVTGNGQRIAELEQPQGARPGTGTEAHIRQVVKSAGSKKQCPTCGRWSTSLAPNHSFCSQCGHSLAGAAKGDAILADDGEGRPDRQCENCKSKFHPERDACPHCGLIVDREGVEKSGGPGLEALTAAEKVHLAALVKRCEDPATRLDSLGELMKELGPHVAVKVIGGEPLSPAEFTRAYLANGRAGLSAGSGQSPRIPDTTHTVSSEDFRRDPLTAGHERPTPLQMLQQAGQMGLYGSWRAGTGTLDSRSGLGNTGTGPSVAIPATVGLGAGG